MINSREQYDSLFQGFWIEDYQFRSADVAVIHGTIEALRDVARAATHFAARGYEKPQPDWRQPTIDALSALPEWILEE